MITEFLPPGDKRWTEFLAGTVHDAYHLPEYVSHCARHEGGEPAAFYAESEGTAFLVPLLIRELPSVLEAPPGWRDMASPYGYSSPLLGGAVQARDLERFLTEFRMSAAAAGMVTAFLRLHPLLPLPSAPLERSGALVRHGETVPIDLSQSAEQIWSETRANHRSGINKLRRRGFVEAIDAWEYLDEFRRIYRLTMERVDAKDFYFFSDSYFAGLRSALEDRLHLASVLAPDGSLAAGGLFTGVGEILQYHLGATNPDYLGDAPSKLLFDAVRRWGKELGFRWLHLGGGVGGESDSVFRFKAGFSSLRRRYHTLRLVLDSGRHDWLTNRWSHLSEGREPKPGWFPVYRQSLETATGTRP